MCIEYSASLRKHTLGIVFCGNVGVIDPSEMATNSKFRPFINLRNNSLLGFTYSGYLL